MSEIEVINTFFNKQLVKKHLDQICVVLKEKLLKQRNTGYIFNYLFFPDSNNIPSQRIIKFDYFINILVLLLNLLRDDDFKDFKIKRHQKEDALSLNDILEEYLINIFSFFENNQFLRYSMIIYPLCYKLSKYFIYGFGVMDNKVKQSIKFTEYFLSEEELSQTFNSKGAEYVRIAEYTTDNLLKDLINNGFDGQEIKKEVFKKTIRDVEKSISTLSKKIDLNKLKKEIPQDEQDEMFAIDNHANNPWQILFLYVIRILNDYKYLIGNNDIKDKIEYLVESGFVSKPLYIQAVYDYSKF